MRVRDNSCAYRKKLHYLRKDLDFKNVYYFRVLNKRSCVDLTAIGLFTHCRVLLIVFNLIYDHVERHHYYFQITNKLILIFEPIFANSTAMHF